MHSPFERTLRSLAAERRSARALVLVAAVLVIGAWIAWAAMSEVGVHIASVTARVEAREPVHVLRAEVEGRLTAVHARLGDLVEPGQILYELDRAEPEIALAEADKREKAVQAEREVLDAALSAATSARDRGQDVLDAALAEARAKTTQARAALSAAERELSRLERLTGDGAVSSFEIDRARLNASLRRAEVGAAISLSERLTAEETRGFSDRTTTVERLRQERVRLDGELARLDAVRRAAEVGLERRKVRAPIRGHLGELPMVRPGDLVTVGQPLGTLVPDGELHAVGYFRTERALGWVVPGARATMRLDAFPWTWFGLVEARVTDVALEPRDGLLRVELALTSPTDGAPAAPGGTAISATKRPAGRLELRHGLTGVVEIEVERTSPLALLLRAAGQKADTP